MKEEALLRKILESNHYKVTKARLIIFSLLQGNEPQTAAHLIASSKGKVNRVSIYRVMDLYEKLGIINRINIGWKYKVELSEVFLAHHHHLSCLECGKVIAVAEDNEIERFIEKVSRKNDFSITSHILELQGYCTKCHGKEN